ncbi:MAG: GTPase ObgE [Spirochaetes bacterium]|nr:GTPase ObgE [Spirochaetota bacterium]
MKKFIDEVFFVVKAGDGGKGALSFERARFKPKGKPDGGDGGNGGDIIARVNSSYSELSHLINVNLIRAQDGKNGGTNNKKGKNGENAFIDIPPGCIIKEKKGRQVITELLSPGEECIMAKGGKGGRGNAFFKSSTNRSPHKTQSGEKGSQRDIIIELKLLADIGLVGAPNVGKSTLLKNMTDAHPKIADYPFTTLSPNLGIFYDKDGHPFSIADIPGLIHGASEGKGLGIQFLKHIERTKILGLLVDISKDNHRAMIETIMQEMKNFNPALLKKNLIIVGNKIDLIDKKKIALLKKLKWPFQVIFISALKEDHIQELKQVFIKQLQRH